MISIEQLNGEIAALEDERPTFVNMEKLAALYTVRDHMTLGARLNQQTATADGEKVETSGSSEFLEAVSGKSINEVLPIIDELMSTIKLLNERLYTGVIKKLTT